MLKHRTLTALVLLIICGGVMFYTPPAIFSACCWLLCLIAIYELTKMYQFTLLQTGITSLVLTMCAVSFAVVHYDLSQIVRIISVAMWCFVAPIILIFTPRKFSKLAIAVFCGLLFIPAYYSFTVFHAIFGPWQLLSLMAIAWVADTGAYFVGKRFGKRKLAKHISPGKTLEGAVGGLVLVIIYLSILHYFNLAYYLPTYRHVFKFAFILTIVSIIGDLLESWFKRIAKVKDSGTILPGHGGIFDRIDSLIAVMAISFAIIRGML